MIWNPPAGSRKRREEMVRTQIERRGVRDERVLEAMRSVPREVYAGVENIESAFRDGPLQIGCGQTISQPYIVAYMTEMLAIEPKDRVLEIGTGCGYQTAVLAELAAEVYTIEIIEELARTAEIRLREQMYANVRFRTGDGSLGWIEAAPFDAIMVTAAPERTPDALVAQLADGGRMIAPVGSYEQHLLLVTKRGERIERRELIGVRFVPMTGRIREEP